ncbi:hypothetical protein [Deinococcus sp. QL22]|uniref:hypothetical protein n=1 Tax=Deinococcus sp. QL22 TaxID=2939437 RepID=UPI002016C499|nr:hypothetical protein [Deinococcus sp. QL22]UQN08090.1 hypothetical protein M1R55_18550 [Deinococcus sp. QL22]
MIPDDLSPIRRWRLTSGAFLGLWLSGTVVAAPGALLPQWAATFGDGLNLGGFYALQFVGLLLGIFLSARTPHRQPIFGLALALMLLGLITANFRVLGGLILARAAGSGPAHEPRLEAPLLSRQHVLAEPGDKGCYVGLHKIPKA